MADGRKIYKSSNNGYSFSLYKNLISNLVGIYKKPNSNKLYAATKGQILEITPDSIKIIKSLPISENVFDWFPLEIGNKWLYSSYSVEYVPGYTPEYHFLGTKIMEVQKDTIINNKTYFILYNDLLNQYVFSETLFLRVDSATGYIFKFLA